MVETNNISLLERFMRGETSSDEEQQLMEWLRTSEGGEQLKGYYYKIWHNSGEELSAEVQGRMFARIKSRMRETRNEEFNRKYILKLKTRRLCQYAAVILLIIGAAIGGHFYTDPTETEKSSSQYLVNTEKGQRANVTLPDGTVVWLNSYTRLSYDVGYGGSKRVVSLTGEAFFDVANDKERPFIVKTKGMDVEALGTTFNVKAYNEDTRIVATLFSGSVRVSAAGRDVTLSPDEDAIWEWSSGKLTVRKLGNSSHASMWRDNELVFNGETLSEIAVLLNRMYNVHIIFKSDEIKEYSFTGVIRNNSLDNVIELISLTSPITYKTKGDTIELNSR